MSSNEAMVSPLLGLSISTPRTQAFEKRRRQTCQTAESNIGQTAKIFAEVAVDNDVEGYARLLRSLSGLMPGKVLYSKQPEAMLQLAGVVLRLDPKDTIWMDELITTPAGNPRILFLRRKFGMNIQSASWLRKMVEHHYRD